MPATEKVEEKSVKDKLSKLHSTGPELEVTKILIKNGLLTSQ